MFEYLNLIFDVSFIYWVLIELKHYHRYQLFLVAGGVIAILAISFIMAGWQSLSIIDSFTIIGSFPISSLNFRKHILEFIDSIKMLPVLLVLDVPAFSSSLYQDSSKCSHISHISSRLLYG
jgi:hypothetical protein